jgi:hypothetical protein
MSSREPYVDGRKLRPVGNSYGTTFPKDQLREHGLLDEDDELRDDVQAEPYVDEERGEIGLVVELPDE